jgi:hypothetical protein
MSRKILILCALVSCVIVASLWASSITPSEQVTVGAQTVYRDGNTATPDSMRIITEYEGSVVYDDWFNSGDAQCSDSAGFLTFTDQLQDIDGSGGVGQYLIRAMAYDDDSSLYTSCLYQFEVGLKDSVYAVLTAVQGVVDANLVSIVGDSADAESLSVWTERAADTSLYADAQTIIDSLRAEIDSVLMNVGMYPGMKRYVIRSANADTVVYLLSGDTITRVIYPHSGGSPGDPPTDTIEVTGD